MDAERYRRVKEVVARALELEGGERDRYVTGTCAGDEDLQREVGRLLEQHGTSCERFLQRPFGIGDETRSDRIGGVSPPKPAKLPASVGPFRVLKLLGQGGMGAVYLCQQDEPVHRQVAVKVIRADLTAPQVAARFDLERQALARLTHPNIAQIHQAGTTADGYPYFAMEYCSGASVTTYCDDHRLTVEERLGLFISICEAVKHAHRRGIIHRDLKPSNIMVTQIDGQPSVKIIDFGIAKAIDEPEALDLTGQGFIGTPQYMSPEALGLIEGTDVDTRTDVYSLGMVLYELLVGMRPHSMGALAAYLTRIANEPTPRPSKRLAGADHSTREDVADRRGVSTEELQRRLVGDLDWIVATALARDPEERYGSSEELAADVRRFLDYRPVLASPPSLTNRAIKFVRRNRALAVVAAVAVLAVVAGTVGTTVGMVRANDEARRASAEAERANDEAAVARDVSEFLAGLFEVSDPSEAKGNAVTARELIDRGAERIEKELSGQPLVQARMMDLMGDIYTALGLYPTAEPLLEKALELRREHLGDDHLDTALTLQNLAELHHHLGHLEEAETIYRQALAIRRPLEAPSVTVTMNNLAALLADQGRTEEAEALYLESLDIRRRLYGDDHASVRSVLAHLGAILRDRGQYDEAEKLHREALAVAERVYGEAHPELRSTLNNLGLTLWKQGRFGAAKPIFRRALDISRQIYGDDHRLTASALNNLALVLKNDGDYDAAEPLYREALAFRRRQFGDEHPSVAVTLNNLASLMGTKGDYAEAESLYREAISLYRRVYDGDHERLGQSLSGLGGVLKAQGDLDAAEPPFREALEMNRRLHGDDHPVIALSLNRLAMLQANRGADDAAESLLRDAVAISRRLLSDHPDVALVLGNLASVLVDRGEVEEAEALARESLSMRRLLLRENHPHIAVSLKILADVENARERHAEAERLVRESLVIIGESLPSDHPQVAHAEITLGAALSGLGQYAEAEAFLLGGSRKLRLRHGEWSSETRRVHDLLIALYTSWGKPAKAAEYRRQLARPSHQSSSRGPQQEVGEKFGLAPIGERS